MPAQQHWGSCGLCEVDAWIRSLQQPAPCAGGRVGEERELLASLGHRRDPGEVTSVSSGLNFRSGRADLSTDAPPTYSCCQFC
jgi:hypothetical protein